MADKNINYFKYCRSECHKFLWKNYVHATTNQKEYPRKLFEFSSSQIEKRKLAKQSLTDMYIKICDNILCDPINPDNPLDIFF
jgi:hypothetical protein